MAKAGAETLLLAERLKTETLFNAAVALATALMLSNRSAGDAVILRLRNAAGAYVSGLDARRFLKGAEPEVDLDAAREIARNEAVETLQLVFDHARRRSR